MARVQATVEIDDAAFKEADLLLAQIDESVRGRTIGNAMRKVLNEVGKKTKQILPKPGYPGDKPENVPLRDTLRTRTRNYQSGTVKVVLLGYSWPGGAHGHLLEGGHDIVKGGTKKAGGRVVGYVPPNEYLIKVVRETKDQHSRQLIDAIKKSLPKQK